MDTNDIPITILAHAQEMIDRQHQTIVEQALEIKALKRRIRNFERFIPESEIGDLLDREARWARAYC